MKEQYEAVENFKIDKNKILRILNKKNDYIL
jgi:hypothetical protein